MWDDDKTPATSGLDMLQPDDRGINCIEYECYENNLSGPFGGPFNALGIDGLPNYTEISPPVIQVKHAELSSRLCEPPPRNPRRLLSQRHSRRDSISIYDVPGIITDTATISSIYDEGEISPLTSTCNGDGEGEGDRDFSPATSIGTPAITNFKAAPGFTPPMLEEPLENSPPNSPDVDAVQDGYVFPMDDVAENNAPILQRSYFNPGETIGTPFESLPESQASVPESIKSRFGSIRDKKKSDPPSSPRRRPAGSSFNSLGQRIRFLGRRKTEPVNVHDNPYVAPLNITRKVSKPTLLGSFPLPPTPTSNGETTSPVAEIADQDLVPSTPSSRPIAINTAAAQSVSGAHSLPTPRQYAYPTPPPHIATQLSRVGSPLSECLTQPRSRFCVSPYAESEPATPRLLNSEQLSAVMERANSMRDRNTISGPSALEGSLNNSTLISRKGSCMSSTWTARSQDPTLCQSNASMSLSRSASILSTRKPLPPAPPELSSSGDRISQLNVLIAGLAHRRININRSIDQITGLMSKEAVATSEEALRKREIEQQKVDGLQQELAEIQRQEYKLGQKLHRAYKKQYEARGEKYEASGLWVITITG